MLLPDSFINLIKKEGCRNMSDISIISMILIVIIAFFAGLDGILDQFQFHQPLVSCTLIGLVTGHLEAGLMLGGTLQMLALGWANIGAAVAPDIEMCIRDRFCEAS